MKYIALLRGINVGGNNLIKMSDLKLAFENAGYTNVITYINSGNVVFESPQTDKQIITTHLEKVLSDRFNYSARLVLISAEELAKTIAEAPTEWKRPNDLRQYVAFIKPHVAAKDVAKEVELKKDVDSLKIGDQVLYLSTKLSGLTKSGFTKLIGKKIYQDITMRNFATVQKLLILTEKI